MSSVVYNRTKDMQSASSQDVYKRQELTMENIARFIEMWTKIPASKIKEEEFKRLAELDQRLRAHVVGQDEAIAAVSAAIRRNRVGISPKHKPVSFIFVGPTGVGKTELVILTRRYRYLWFYVSLFSGA